MKQILKNYLKIGTLLFGIPLLFFTCMKDDTILEIQETQYSEKPIFNTTIVSYEHLKSKNMKLALKIDKLVEKKFLQRSAIPEDYGFTIKDEYVKIMELDGFKTYTFLVFKDNPEPNILENYVFKESNDGTYEQYLLKYAYSLDEYDKKVYDTTFFEIKTIIDDNEVSQMSVGCEPEFVNVFSGIECNIRTTCWGLQASGTHEVGDNCECQNTPETCYRAGSTECSPQYIFVYQGCSGGNQTIGGDQDNETDPNDGSTGGSGGSGGSDGSDDSDDSTKIEIPAIPFDDYESIKDGCKSLKKLSNTDDFSVNINPLVGELLGLVNEDHEYSVSFRKYFNYEEEHSKANNEGVQEGDSKTSSDLKIGTSQFGGAHTHPVGTIQMFLWKDVYELKNLYEKLLDDFNKKDVFLMVVNADSTVYAMKINDFDLLDSKLNEEKSNINGRTTEIKIKKLNRNLASRYRKSDNLEYTFLKKFTEYGVSLFKANDVNLSNWSKLELKNPSSNDRTVLSQPCN